jgi:ElaB/YqjD/DUF883 family membrane-anchored ribosome-binding protein
MSEEFESGKLAAQLDALAEEAEAVLQASGSGNGTDAQHERLSASVASLRARLASLEEAAGARARQLDEFVHENPWRSIAVAGCAGLILGLLLARR